MWPVIMAVSCYHVQQPLLLAWYSLTLDWTIFHPESALLPVVLTIQRRPSPKSVYIYPKRVWSVYSVQPQGMGSKLITSKEHILANYSDVFDSIGYFLVPIPYPGQYLVSHPSKPPVNQSLYISKSLSRNRLTRCYKQEFWSLWTKQLLGSTVLFL